MKNRTTGQGHTTMRYFVPYEGEKMEKAATAGGSRRDRGELGPVAAKKRSYKRGGGSGGVAAAAPAPAAVAPVTQMHQQMQMQVQQPAVGTVSSAPEPSPTSGELVGGRHFTRSVGGTPPPSAGEEGGDNNEMEEE